MFRKPYLTVTAAIVGTLVWSILSVPAGSSGRAFAQTVPSTLPPGASPVRIQPPGTAPPTKPLAEGAGAVSPPQPGGPPPTAAPPPAPAPAPPPRRLRRRTLRSNRFSRKARCTRATPSRPS